MRSSSCDLDYLGISLVALRSVFSLVKTRQIVFLLQADEKYATSCTCSSELMKKKFIEKQNNIYYNFETFSELESLNFVNQFQGTGCESIYHE